MEKSREKQRLNRAGGPHRAAKSRPGPCGLRGSLPPLAAGIRSSCFGRAREGNQKLCKTECKTNHKGGTKGKHGNHQGTTQTTKISDGPGPSGGVGEDP